MPFTVRKEALILSAKKTLNLKPYLCAALLFHLCKNLETVASSLGYTLGLGVKHSVVK